MPAQGVLALVELGVGCDRAVVLDAAGALVEAHLERPGPRPGDVWTVRLLRREAGGWAVALGEAGEARLDGPATGLAEGALLRVMVVRAPIPGPGRAKPARVRPVPGLPGSAPGLATAAPDLATRLRGRGLRVEAVPAAGPDRLGAAGWAEAVAEARLDAPIPFRGGELLAAMTEAGLVIDVDGHLPPEPLALAAVPALAGLLARHDQGGSVLVDFPTLTGRGPRAAVDAALGVALARLPGGAGERTAINGFG
ncbi:MAG: ribonuclease, partial [Sphingomonadaceae bacterium]